MSAKRVDRRHFLGAIAGAAWFVGAPRRAEATELDDVLAAITRARASLRTLVAPFTQVRTIGLLATEVKSDGELTLVAPDRLRWELSPPDAITYWVTPEGFAFATPDGGGSIGKAAAGRFAVVLSDLLVLVGGDLSALRARYDLTVTRHAASTRLAAAPRDPEIRRQLVRLEMEMGPELWTVQRIGIEEAGGDRSEITFRDVRRDAPVDAARMKPPGR